MSIIKRLMSLVWCEVTRPALVQLTSFLLRYVSGNDIAECWTVCRAECVYGDCVASFVSFLNIDEERSNGIGQMEPV